MKKALHIALTILVLCLSSCVSINSKIEQIHLDGAFILHSSPNFKGYFYQGSDSDFHYFVSKWQFSKDKRFKVLKSEVDIKEPFEFETKEQAIAILKTQEALANKIAPRPFIILK